MHIIISNNFPSHWQKESGRTQWPTVYFDLLLTTGCSRKPAKAKNSTQPTLLIHVHYKKTLLTASRTLNNEFMWASNLQQLYLLNNAMKRSFTHLAALYFMVTYKSNNGCPNPLLSSHHPSWKHYCFSRGGGKKTRMHILQSEFLVAEIAHKPALISSRTLHATTRLSVCMNSYDKCSQKRHWFNTAPR